MERYSHGPAVAVLIMRRDISFSPSFDADLRDRTDKFSPLFIRLANRSYAEHFRYRRDPGPAFCDGIVDHGGHTRMNGSFVDRQ